MSFLPTRLSTAVAWAMIPVAAWAGMPSTACVCANGHVKLFCAHGAAIAKPHDHQAALGCMSSCCTSGAYADADCEHDADCCGGGYCCHGAKAGTSDVSSKACCRPILTAPSVAPQTFSVPSEQAPAVIVVAEEIGTLAHPSFIADLAEINTGPPLDRVIVFRSLLI